MRGTLLVPATAAPHPALIFIHGLLSSREEFGEYPNRFCQAGFLVLAIDLRGHGQSDGLRGYITQDRMVQDTRAAIDFVAAQPSVDPERIALIGHSLGGVAVLCAAAQDRRVHAVIAGATVRRLRDVIGPIELASYFVVDWINHLQKKFTGQSLYVPYRVTYKDIFFDPQARAAAQAKGFLQRSTPADNIQPLLHQDAGPCAARLQIPALIISSEFDRVVNPSSSRQVYDLIPGKKTWYEVKGSGHSFATDAAKDVAFDAISRWLGEHLHAAAISQSPTEAARNPS